LYTIGEAYDIPSSPVDAMNVIQVHHAVSKAAERARKGLGPSLLEFRTYRYKGHSMSDPAKYRSKNELELYKQKDPIEQIKNIMLLKKIYNDKDFELINRNIKEQVNDSVEFAEKSPYPSKDDVYQYIYKQENYPFLIE